MMADGRTRGLRPPSSSRATRHPEPAPAAAPTRTGTPPRAPAADAGLPPEAAPTARGITMVNIGVGPSNAKTITDHIAVLRPHAWLMLGHCAGLRNTPAARRLRAGPRLCARGPRARRRPAALGADPAAGRGAGGAGEAPSAEVTGLPGYELKRIMRTGTVATIDNRNWELRDQHRDRSSALQPEPRHRARHGKRHDRRQRLPLPRALRHAAVRLATSRCTAR